MSDLLFIGPYNEVTITLITELEKKFEVAKLQFDQEDKLVSSSPWYSLPITNFHDLTVKLMESEPERVIYFPPMLDYHRCEKDPEDAYISNEEAIEHIKEVLSVKNVQFILFSSDLVLSSIDCILGNSISLGEEIARSYSRSSIVRLSPFEEQVTLQEGTDKIQLLDKTQFSRIISQILHNLQYETYNMAGEMFYGSLDRPIAYIDDRKLRNLMK
jgi:dTDP-4-dehydrorhamnose reductase